MKFYFIAVNFNGYQFTCDYIKSVNNIGLNKDDTINIIIVDNGSSTAEYKDINEHVTNIANVELIRLEKNIGYFKGMNEGILKTEKDENTIIIIGNNDLTFDAEFLTNYKAIDYSDDVLIIAPNITTKDGRMQNPHVIESVTRSEKFKCKIYYSNYYIGQIFKFFNSFLKPKKIPANQLTNNHPQMKIKRGIGACYIMTQKFFEHFEKLDDKVFLWGEEVLLSTQIESVSGTMLYDPSIKITHHESASVNKIATKSRYNINKASYKKYKNNL
jgi:GT2 family glycosyltransferase